MTGRQRRLILIGSALHLALVASYAAHLDLAGSLPVGGDVVALYGAVSGAHAEFNFFAPAVAAELRAYAIVETPTGIVREDFRTDSAEVNLRLSSMFNSYVVDSARPLMRRSWAAYAVRLHPDALAVTVHVDLFDMPTLAEAQRGAIPQWREVDSERFVLSRD